MSPNPPTKSEQIRTTTTADLPAIRHVHLQAFADRPNEADLVDLLHAANKAMPSLVATSNGAIVAHILFSPVTIHPPHPSLKIVGLGPIAVLPTHQRRGIGSRLIRAGIQACLKDKIDAIVVLGGPAFYSRFEFLPAMSYQLTNEYVNDAHFMIRELRSGAMKGVSGLVRYAPEFKSANC